MKKDAKNVSLNSERGVRRGWTFLRILNSQKGAALMFIILASAAILSLVTLYLFQTQGRKTAMMREQATQYDSAVSGMLAWAEVMLREQRCLHISSANLGDGYAVHCGENPWDNTHFLGRLLVSRSAQYPESANLQIRTLSNLTYEVQLNQIAQESALHTVASSVARGQADRIRFTYKRIDTGYEELADYVKISIFAEVLNGDKILAKGELDALLYPRFIAQYALVLNRHLILGDDGNLINPESFYPRSLASEGSNVTKVEHKDYARKKNILPPAINPPQQQGLRFFSPVGVNGPVFIPNVLNDDLSKIPAASFLEGIEGVSFHTYGNAIASGGDPINPFRPEAMYFNELDETDRQMSVLMGQYRNFPGIHGGLRAFEFSEALVNLFAPAMDDLGSPFSAANEICREVDAVRSAFVGLDRSRTLIRVRDVNDVSGNSFEVQLGLDQYNQFREMSGSTAKTQFPRHEFCQPAHVYDHVDFRGLNLLSGKSIPDREDMAETETTFDQWPTLPWASGPNELKNYIEWTLEGNYRQNVTPSVKGAQPNLHCMGVGNISLGLVKRFRDGTTDCLRNDCANRADMVISLMTHVKGITGNHDVDIPGLVRTHHKWDENDEYWGNEDNRFRNAIYESIENPNNNRPTDLHTRRIYMRPGQEVVISLRPLIRLKQNAINDKVTYCENATPVLHPNDCANNIVIPNPTLTIAVDAPLDPTDSSRFHPHIRTVSWSINSDDVGTFSSDWEWLLGGTSGNELLSLYLGPLDLTMKQDGGHADAIQPAGFFKGSNHSNIRNIRGHLFTVQKNINCNFLISDDFVSQLSSGVPEISGVPNNAGDDRISWIEWRHTGPDYDDGSYVILSANDLKSRSALSRGHLSTRTEIIDSSDPYFPGVLPIASMCPGYANTYVGANVEERNRYAFHSWNYKPLSADFQFIPEKLGEGESLSDVNEYNSLYDLSKRASDFGNKLVISDYNQNVFHTYSVLDYCEIRAAAQVAMGFLTCRRLKIEDRSQPLKMIGTFIVDQLEIDRSVVSSGIEWMNVFHPYAEETLREHQVIRAGCPVDPASPVWRSDNIEQSARFKHCSQAGILLRSDPMNWSSFTPRCVTGSDATECQPFGLHYQYDSYIFSERRREK